MLNWSYLTLQIMSDKAIWYLENIDVTGVFCPKKMDSAHDQLFHKKFSKGDYIYLPDEYSDKIYLINQGRVKVGSYGTAGKEVTKAILAKGEVFGELALLGEERRRDFAVAMEPTQICLLTVDELNGLMRDHSALSMFIMKVLGSRVLDMEQRLESLVFKDSRSRIIEFIVNTTEKKGQRVGYEHVIRKFLTHQEIANITATSRQTVTSVLNELRSRDLLIFNRRRMLIRDLDALRRELR